MVEDVKNKELAIGKGPSGAEERASEEVEEGEIALDAAHPEAQGPDGTAGSHPLEHSWTFWFDHPSTRARQASWGTAIRPIHTFATVEELWGLYNNINRPSKLSVGADFHCFKHGIEPKWEDPICANGGKWTISCSRGNQGKIDMWWLHTLLAMIGEQFDNGDEICGAVVNIRAKQEKISIWTKNGFNEAAQVSIGKQWKEFLDYNENIGFILHDDAKKLERSAKNRYTV